MNHINKISHKYDSDSEKGGFIFFSCIFLFSFLLLLHLMYFIYCIFMYMSPAAKCI